MSVETMIEAVYESLRNDNADLDNVIKNLKAAMKEEGAKEAVFDASKLAQNNRQGRKLMQSYFKQRGVIIKFSTTEA